MEEGKADGESTKEKEKEVERWAPFYFRLDVEFVLPSLPFFVVFFFSIDLTNQDNEDEIPFQKWPQEMSGEQKKKRNVEQAHNTQESSGGSASNGHDGAIWAFPDNHYLLLISPCCQLRHAQQESSSSLEQRGKKKMLGFLTF